MIKNTSLDNNIDTTDKLNNAVEDNLDKISNFINQLILKNSKLEEEFKNALDEQKKIQDNLDEATLSLKKKEQATQIIENKILTLLNHLDQEQNTLFGYNRNSV